MTVKEFIKKLQEYPEDWPVITHEGGSCGVWMTAFASSGTCEIDLELDWIKFEYDTPKDKHNAVVI